MTDRKITDLPAGVPSAGDWIPFVDISDTTTSPADANGSGKRSTLADLVGSVLAPCPDQLPAREHGLLGASGVTALYAAIANRDNARVDIPVIGDSITEGQGGSFSTSGWLFAARRAIRYAYPTAANGSTGGRGFIPIQSTGSNTFSWPITSTGTPGMLDLGPVRGCTNATASGASWSWTAPAGTTSVQICYYDGTTAGSFNYKVGSGSTTTVSNAGSSVDKLTASIPITGGQVLTITWVSGGVFLTGLMHYAGDESSGITFHGCGHYGWNASATAPNGWQQPETYSLNWIQAYANAFPTTPAAVGIMLGVNDARTNNGGGNFTAAQFQANLTSLIAAVRGAGAALANVPVLLIIPYQPNETFADTGGWAAYTAAIRAVAAGVTNTLVIDLNYRLPTVASNWDSGALYHDSYHPSNLGHGLIGETVSAALKIA